MEGILLVFFWFFGAFFIGFVFGTARSIGFWGSFLLSLLLSPLIGLLITLFSETKKRAKERLELLNIQKQQAESLKVFESNINNKSVSSTDELLKLKELLDNGGLSIEEYEVAKKRILGLA